MTPEEIGTTADEIIAEVSSKIEEFESQHQDKLLRTGAAWDMYKGVPGAAHRREADGLANTFVYESPRIVDALTTTQYRMMMSQAPFWEARGQTGNVSDDILYRNSALLERQLEWVQYRKNLYRALKSANLMGTVVVEQPWLQGPMVDGSPTWEAAGFIPRPINQVFFAANAVDMESADYIGTIDIVTNYRLLQFAESDPQQTAWSIAGLYDAMQDPNEKLPQAVMNRLTSARSISIKGIKTMETYYGPLECAQGGGEWVVGLVNRRHLVRLHRPPIPERPLRVAYASWIEQEPYGLGIKDSELLQKMLNSNRNRVFDLITFGLYSMFKLDRYAGLDLREARIRPWNFLIMDNIQGIEPMRPDMNAAQFGIKLEEMLKEEFQSRTGAAKNLQAITTDVTATEVNVVMDNATRKIGVDAEIMAEPLCRQPLYYMHKMNQLFVDQPIWIAATGERGPMMVSPSDVAHNLDFKVKIVTDKDFRPNRLRRLIELIQILTSVRNDIPALNLLPLIAEAVRLHDVNPALVTNPPQSMQQPQMMDLAMQNFERQRARLGLLTKEGGMFGQPAPLAGSQETPLPYEQ